METGETIEQEGFERFGSKDIKGETYEEISKSVGEFTNKASVSEPEYKKQLQSSPNLRKAFLLLLGAREPMMIGDFKNELNMSKPWKYKMFYKLRELGLVKNISVMNIFIEESPYIQKDDLMKDDRDKFNEKEKKAILNKFRKWTSGMKSNKQKQNYLSGTFYWDISERGKSPQFLKWVTALENSYRKMGNKEKE